MRIAIIVLVLIQALLSGCTTIPVPHDVNVPLAVPCVRQDKIPPPPSITPNQELMKLDRRKRTLTTWDERAQLKADDDELRALLQACSGGQ